MYWLGKFEKSEVSLSIEAAGKVPTDSLLAARLSHGKGRQRTASTVNAA